MAIGHMEVPMKVHQPASAMEDASQSWDITKLKGPVKWSWYLLYLILDIFSRYVVG